jgi:glutaredoxin-like protein NrdH
MPEDKKPFLYTLSTCIHCRNTKEFLSDHGVEYDSIDVDKLQGEERRRIIEELKQYNPNLSFPTIIIGDHVIVGFKKDELLKCLEG